MLTKRNTHDNINELRVKHILVEHETQTIKFVTEPWQINSNATLKILWEISVSEENTLKNYNSDKEIQEIIPLELFQSKSLYDFDC